jgi:hypothetical protein
MARPPANKLNDDGKVSSLLLHLKHEQKAWLEKRAQQQSKPMAAVLRDLIDAARKTPRADQP